MIIVNFSHPLTPAQIAQVEEITDEAVNQVVDVPLHLDGSPVIDQIYRIFSEHISGELARCTTIVNLPGLSIAAACVLAEWLRRSAMWPRLLRIAAVPGIPPRYNVVEVVDLAEWMGDNEPE